MVLPIIAESVESCLAKFMPVTVAVDLPVTGEFGVAS